jgi:hypothetical protein
MSVLLELEGIVRRPGWAGVASTTDSFEIDVKGNGSQNWAEDRVRLLASGAVAWNGQGVVGPDGAGSVDMRFSGRGGLWTVVTVAGGVAVWSESEVWEGGKKLGGI